MTSESDSEHESQLSSDRETIQDWTGEHDVVPVRVTGTGGESGTLILVQTERQTADHEEVTWDEFYEEIDEGDKTVVYHGATSEEPFEVLDRSEAIERTAMGDESVEEALLAGEVVTTEVTETTVVERTIVEEASIESEVIDREVAQVDILDADLLTREAVDCEVTDLGPSPSGEEYEPSRFESGYRTDDSIEVAAQVDETWDVTKEVLERLTIESRLTDMDVTETETVEDDQVESTIDIEGIQRTVLDSDLVETDAATTEIIDSGSIESEFGEGEVVHTQLFERKLVEEEVDLEKRYVGEITGGETISVSTVDSAVVESDVVGGEDIEFEIETVVDTVTEVEADLEAQGETEADLEAGTEEPTVTDDTTTAEGDVSGEDTRVTPTEDDEGKTVVDAQGEEIGMVAEVEDGTIYVDPDPSITAKIKARLDWGGKDEDAYPLPSERVVRITRDEVELDVGK